MRVLLSERGGWGGQLQTRRGVDAQVMMIMMMMMMIKMMMMMMTLRMFDKMQHWLARLCWDHTVSSCMATIPR